MTYGQLWARYKKRHGGLVQPRQGWSSLVEDLWLAYSIGRARGFTDLGTYVAKPLDHGGWPNPPPHPPAYAFDLGREDRFLFRGWGYLKARRLAKLYVEHHRPLGINYVILGNRIWSREHPYWHHYEDKDHSHSFHIHVSGIHPDL